MKPRIGINGAGKSTLQNAIALMLGRNSSVVRTDRVSTTTFDREQMKREDCENEKRPDGTGVRDPELTAVRHAIAGMLNDRQSEITS